VRTSGAARSLRTWIKSYWTQIWESQISRV